MNKQEYIKTYKELNRKLDRADNKQTKLQNKKSTLSDKIYDINNTYRNTVYPCKKEILLKDFKDFKGQVINTNSHATGYYYQSGRPNLDEPLLDITFKVQVHLDDSIKKQLNKVFDEQDETLAELIKIEEPQRALKEEIDELLFQYAVEYGKYKLGDRIRFADGITYTISKAIAYNSVDEKKFFGIFYQVACAKIDNGSYFDMDRNIYEEAVDDCLTARPADIIKKDEEVWQLPSRTKIDAIEFDETTKRAILKTKKGIYIIVDTAAYITRSLNFSEFLSDFNANRIGASLVFSRNKYNSKLYYDHNKSTYHTVDIIEAFATKEEYVARAI